VVTVAGREVKLTPKQYDLLRVLVVHAGKVMTHQQLLRQVWGPAYGEESQYLRVYVAQLRQKIEPDPTRPRYILTEPGVGYRLRDPDETTPP
jgi:two-component system KDP operon response regulator KdpE